MIEIEILQKYKHEVVHYKKGDVLFKKNDTAKYYFQIIFGGVKMSSFNSKGNEFIQGIFGKGKSFGEPPLFADFNYPANAIALSKTTVLKITKTEFQKLLIENSDVHLKFTKMLSKRLYFKAVMANGITSNSAEEAITSLFDYLKNNIYEESSSFSTKIDLTRKNIAGLTGLTIETTIRKIKEMEKKGLVTITDGIVYY